MAHNRAPIPKSAIFALGQKQTWAAHKPMSAECQKRTFPHIRLTQLGTSSVDAIGNSISKMEP